MIGTLLKLYLGNMWTFLKPFIAMFLSGAGKMLAAAAIEAVAAVGQTYGDADGDTKRKAAFAIIEDKLKRQGVILGAEVTTSMINGAIEAAVAGLK